MKAFGLILKLVFVLVAWVFWLMFGTLFWLSLVARALAVFAWVFLYAMFTQQESPIIYRDIEDLADLWFRGFRNAYASVFSDTVPPTRIEHRNSRLLIEGAWGIAFWYLAFLAWSGQLLIAFSHYGAEVGIFAGNAAIAFQKHVQPVVSSFAGSVLVGFITGFLVFVLVAIALESFLKTKQTKNSVVNKDPNE